MSGKESELQYTRVVIVDDHPQVRQGLGVFLKSHNDILLDGEAASGEEAVQICMRLQPDIVLIDIMMPDMDGVMVIDSILKVCPKTKIIALTSFYEKKLLKEAFAAGAIGYLLKDILGEDLIAAIRAGRSALSPEAAKALISYTMKVSASLHGLTKREMQVLFMMTEGLNNKQIAEKLFVSRSTVRSQISSILSKFGVSSRTEAVSLALRDKMVK